MPEQSNQASLQRRANWVGLRTLRQRPKLVGATTDGEPVYEIRSVRLVLRGLAPHFNRLAPCARCGKDVPGAPVLAVADLERPLRPMICADCVRGTGVSTVWDPETARPPAAKAEEAEAPAALQPVEPVVVPVPAPPDDGRLESFERHLRAVTERVNALGHAIWAQRSEAEERRREEESAGAAVSRLEVQVAAVAGVGERVDAQRAELAAVLSGVNELRSELQRLSDANRSLVRSHQDLERRLAEVPAPAAPAPPAGPPEELTALLAAHAQLERRVAEAESRAAGATQADGVMESRLEELERRLSDQIAGQWGDLETAIEGSVRVFTEGLVRAHEELAGHQAGILERLHALAGEVALVSGRMDALASWVGSANERLDALEERAERALLVTGPRLEAPSWPPPAEPPDAPAGGLLESLERQLQDAALRLAARSDRAPVE